MATQSRARMFHATAKTLQIAAERRVDDVPDPNAMLIESPEAADVLPDIELERITEPVVDVEELRNLHAELRWAESRLMQASERLAEAQEARRKDLIAIERMRIDLKRSLEAERRYLSLQHRMFADLLPALRASEAELDELVQAGTPTRAVVQGLAQVRTERKLIELAMAQVEMQVALAEENEANLDHDVFNQRYDRSPDGESMREIARLRSLLQTTKRSSMAARAHNTELLDTLDLDRSAGELAAIAAFLAGEAEGDQRSSLRTDRVRRIQIRHELNSLPEPSAEWKAGLMHPISWMKSRKRMPQA